MAQSIKYDIFVSYASEDMDYVVFPLVDALYNRGVTALWLDQVEIHVSESIRKAIEKGLSSSRYIMPVLSKMYFRKHWTGMEFDAALTMKRGIIPIWHDVTARSVKQFSPIVSGVKGILFTEGSKLIADQIAELLISDKRTFFAKNPDPHAGQYAFWGGATCYLMMLLGIAPHDADEQIASIGPMHGLSFSEFYASELNINESNIDDALAIFPELTAEEFVVAMIQVLKDQKKGWTPPTHGWEEVAEKLQQAENKEVT